MALKGGGRTEGCGGENFVGVSHDSPRTPNVHTRRFKHHQKNHEKTHSERQKEREMEAGEGEKKKRNILGPPPFWAHRMPSTLRGPFPFGPLSPSRPQLLRAPTTRLRPPPPKTKLAKCGLAKFGQTKLAKFGQKRLAKCGQLSLAKCGIGQIRIGQMRPNKDGQIRFWPNAVATVRPTCARKLKTWKPLGQLCAKGETPHRKRQACSTRLRMRKHSR